MVKKIELNHNITRRVTRQMTKHIRTAKNNSNILRETNAQNSDILHSEQNNKSAATSEEMMDNLTEDNISNGNSVELFMEVFGDGTENKITLDDAWLTSRGFVKNKAKDERCYICHHNVDDGVMNKSNEIQHCYYTALLLYVQNTNQI